MQSENKVDILLVEDEKIIHLFIKKKFGSFANVRSAFNRNSALIELKELPDIVILDIHLSLSDDGLELLKEIKADFPDLPVIMLSGKGDPSIVAESLKSGAEDFIYKPDLGDPEYFKKFKELIKKHSRNLADDQSTACCNNIEGFENVIGYSKATKTMLNLAKLVAPEDINVLLIGETGTGKEVIANAIHKNSNRSDNPFISINSAAIPEALAESELFGHVKGAFTGAISNKKGKFELADTGTLFLDEIGEMSLSLQSKILKAIEEKVITPVGAHNPVKIDCRIISATNKDLEQEVKEKRFREDLYYRLHGFPIHLPSLNERKNDIQLLTEHFIKKYKPNRKIELTSDLVSALRDFYYKGNIRQLENMVQYALIISVNGKLKQDHFPMLKKKTDSPEIITLAESEKRAILSAMNAAKSKKVEAAEFLDISRPTLDKKIKEYNIKF